MANDNDFKGSVFTEINENITLGCISPEAADLLDNIMKEWDKYYDVYMQHNKEKPSYYGFAYWLVRWSCLIQPNLK